MGIAAEIADDWHAALAALAWEVEAGADETIQDAPVNRYELAAEAPKPLAAKVVSPPVATDPIQAEVDRLTDEISADSISTW